MNWLVTTTINATTLNLHERRVTLTREHPPLVEKLVAGEWVPDNVPIGEVLEAAREQVKLALEDIRKADH